MISDTIQALEDEYASDEIPLGDLGEECDDANAGTSGNAAGVSESTEKRPRMEEVNCVVSCVCV